MRILRFFPANLKEIIKEIKSALRTGKLIIFPTDTVYGLICDATNAEAVKKIFEIKKRSKEKPIGIFAKNIKMAKEFAKIGEKQENFLKQLGEKLAKTTFVLERKESCSLPEILFSGKSTIGIRIPDYELIWLLFKEIDFPLAQTSANISDQPATTKIKEVLKQFEKQKIKPNLVIDAGNLKKAKPSTVIDLTGKEPKILRKGGVSKELF